MRPALPLFAIAGLVLAVASCSNRDADKDARQAARVKRQQAALAKLDGPLQQRSWKVGQHEVVQLDVPSADRFGFVEKRRCIVWRDAEYKTASLSCDSRDSINIDASGFTEDADPVPSGR